MLINWQAVKTKNLSGIIYDFVMILIAIINIALISFDYTYFSFRDFYFHKLNNIVEIYDPIKGVEPHRFTQKYISQADTLFSNPDNKDLKLKLIKSSEDMIIEKIKPFEISKKTGDFEHIKEQITKFMNLSSSRDSFKSFWLDLNEENKSERKTFFDQNIKYEMETNFWRRKAKSGGYYVNYFFYIDLFFIIIFLTEFFVMWIISSKEDPDQKILYPIYHWYDIVSCIPFDKFRFLRLLRFLAVYYRLIKSDILTIGDDPVSRKINYFKKIVSEEIGDNVNLQILSDTQEKIKLGANRTIIQETLKPHKEEIVEILLESIKKLEISLIAAKQNEWTQFISEILEESIKENPEFKKIASLPYLSTKVNQLVSYENISKVVDQSMESFNITLKKTLYSKKGNDFVKDLIGDIFDESMDLMNDKKIQELTEDINLKFIEELKKGSKSKVWKTKNNKNINNG